MKLLFGFLLLLNVVVLLLELRDSPVEPPVDTADRQLANILTVDEYNAARRGSAISAVMDDQVETWRVQGMQQFSAQSAVDEVRRLLLTSARPAATPIVEPTATTVPTVVPLETDSIKNEPKPIMVCFLAGPFKDEATTQHWLRANNLHNKVEIVFQDVGEPTDYQVYYPAAKSIDQQRINKMMLNAKGIEDLWLIPSGEIKGGYSLGVFTDPQRAELFRSQLLDKGIKADIKARYKEAPQVFARVVLDKNLQQPLISRAAELLKKCR